MKINRVKMKRNEVKKDDVKRTDRPFWKKNLIITSKSIKGTRNIDARE